MEFFVHLYNFTVGPVVRQVSYLTHSKRKLQDLQAKVEDLDAVREGVQHDIDQAVRKGKRVEAVVENWKTKVDALTEEAHKFLKHERHAETKCLHGLCPNLVLRYRLRRKSTKLLGKVVQLHAEKEFPNFSYDIRPQEVCTHTGEYTTSDSRTSTMKEIMDELRNPDTDMILVYGIAGIGKTTLAEEVLRKSIQEKLFDDVVMVRDVKENPDLGRIQKEISTKLGLEVQENQSLFERAPFLCDRIKDKKTLVILDDVWEALDLVAMGLPRLERCKILLTSRCRKELSLDFRKQKVFRLDIFGEKDAWELFEKMAGDIVKEDHDIRNIATQVAKSCGGLPVLVVTVARGLRYRTTLPPWKDALRRLKETDNEELTRKAFLALEWSYKQLDEELKPLFLLCGTNLPQNSAKLLKYAMGLALFKNIRTIEEAQNALYSWKEKLKDFGLLLDDSDDRRVRMHDLVRDVARSIVARDEHALSVPYAGELKEWPTKEVLEKCSSISLIYCSTPRLPEVLQCPELKFLCLARRNNYEMQELPSNFFQVMIELKVLDLTGLCLIPSLPQSLQFLKNLRTLCLDQCELGDISLVGQLGSLEILSLMYSKIKFLPKEIGQLTRLRLLDLTYCLDLQVISPDVISSLKSLEDLRMTNSFQKWEDENNVVGERTNASLSELKNLSHLTALEIHIPDACSLPADLFSDNCLERYQLSIGDSDIWEYKIFETSTLNTLNLKLSKCKDLNSGLQMLLETSEAVGLDGSHGTEGTSVKEGFPQLTHLHIIESKVQLSNLRTLKVHKCDGEFLLSSSTARSLIHLKHLQVSGCPLLVEIVSRKECSEDNDSDIMFHKLEQVELRDLPNLVRFYSGNYIELASLQILELDNCTKLGSFVCENNISCNEIEEADSKDKSGHDTNHDNEITVSLLDEKARLPQLKRLYMNRLPKLMTIWHNRVPPEFDLQNLNSVEIWFCGSLRNIFPASLVVRGLQHLKKLKVCYCNDLEEIIAKEDDDGGESTPPEFVFPRVTSMEFRGLEKVRSFYPGMHVVKVPLFNHLDMINNCSTALMKLGAEEKHEWDHHSAPINVSLFFIQKVMLANLTLLSVDGSDDLKILFTSSMARGLTQLKHLRISNCAILEEIISTEGYIEENAGDMFCKLKHLELRDLPHLARFCSGSYIQLMSLEKLELENCTELGSFITDCMSISITSSDETEERVSMEMKLHSDTAAHCSLFGEKASFPLLETLAIDGLGKIMTIWHTEIAWSNFCQLTSVNIKRCDSLIHIFNDALDGSTTTLNGFEGRNLNSVEIGHCGSLRNIFPASMAKVLHQLEKLQVVYCGVLVEIVAREEKLQTNTSSPGFVFPRITSVEFRHLPLLAHFYPGMHTSEWPALKQLEIYGCHKVKIFAAEFSMFHDISELEHMHLKKPLFFIKKIIV